MAFRLTRRQGKRSQYIRSSGGGGQVQITLDGVVGANLYLGRVEPGCWRFTGVGGIESENALRPRDGSYQRRFDQPLKVHRQIEASGAQLPPGARQALKRPPIEKHHRIDVRISFEQHAPLRFDDPGDLRVWNAVLEAGDGG